jgi:hypothetical protein
MTSSLDPQVAVTLGAGRHAHPAEGKPLDARRLAVSIAIAVTVLGASGCSAARPGPARPAASASQPTAAFDITVLARDLKHAGLDVGKPQTTARGAFGASGRPAMLSVGGHALQIYTFATSTEASRVASQISADGSAGPFGGLPFSLVEWKGAPHLFRRGRLVVIYVGLPSSSGSGPDESRLLRAIAGSMGPQFAGSR